MYAVRFILVRFDLYERVLKILSVTERHSINCLQNGQLLNGYSEVAPTQIAQTRVKCTYHHANTSTTFVQFVMTQIHVDKTVQNIV